MTKALRRPVFLIGLVITLALFAVALLSLVWTPFPPTKMNIVQKLKAPLDFGLLGTDQFGRDVASMLMVGAWNSLSTSVLAVLLGASIGTATGVIVAMRRGGWSSWSCVAATSSSRCPRSCRR